MASTVGVEDRKQSRVQPGGGSGSVRHAGQNAVFVGVALPAGSFAHGDAATTTFEFGELAGTHVVVLNSLLPSLSRRNSYSSFLPTECYKASRHSLARWLLG